MTPKAGTVDTVLAFVATAIVAAGAAWGMVEIRIGGVERLLEAQAASAAAEHAAIRNELQILIALLKSK